MYTATLQNCNKFWLLNKPEIVWVQYHIPFFFLYDNIIWKCCEGESLNHILQAVWIWLRYVIYTSYKPPCIIFRISRWIIVKILHSSSLFLKTCHALSISFKKFTVQTICLQNIYLVIVYFCCVIIFLTQLQIRIPLEAETHDIRVVSIVEIIFTVLF